MDQRQKDFYLKLRKKINDYLKKHKQYKYNEILLNRHFLDLDRRQL